MRHSLLILVFLAVVRAQDAHAWGHNTPPGSGGSGRGTDLVVDQSDRYHLSTIAYATTTPRARYYLYDASIASWTYVDAIKEALRLRVRDAAVTDSYVGLGLISVSEGNGEYALRLFLKALHLSPTPETKTMLESKIADLRGR